MARQRISPWSIRRRGAWVQAAVRPEARDIPGLWGAVRRIVLALVERRPRGCPRRRWHRLQRAQRMGRLA